MTFEAAIRADLTSAIATYCHVSQERADDELAAATKAAKNTGLPLAETLQKLGLVAP